MSWPTATMARCSFLLPCLLGWAATPAAVAKDPTYTEAQAGAGAAVYERRCQTCHGEDLAGSHLAPGLVGERFDQAWRGRTLDLLDFHMRRMPPGLEGRLGDEAYTQVLAYTLQVNGFAPSDTELPTGTEALRSIRIPQLEGVDPDPDAPVTPTEEQAERLAKLSPVTDEMLASPPTEDWLQWGRAADGSSFSPLTKIDRESVSKLKTAWRARLRPGVSMAMPLVHDGILFLHAYPDTVLAMDATTGDVLWRYQHRSAAGSSQKMGMALHGDRLYVPTSDLHVLALEAKTGELVWDHQIEPETSPSGRGGHQLRSAPLVAGGRVIQGVTASFASRGGFLVGIDLETGEEAWRFNSIPRPGEPGDETWNDVPLDRRSGGSVWHQGTWDPELDLVYYGIAPTYDTGPLLHPSDEEGITNDALYTNCTVALRPKTGELVWFYQHMANDQWDLDWAFERTIATVPVDGEPRKVVMNVGKMAIVEALDAATGEYLFSVDPGIQNVITAIDPETGAKTIDPSKLPDPERPTVVCPSASGARAWPPTAYSPETHYVYLPLTEWCMRMAKEGARLLTSGVGIAGASHPSAEDGTMGRVQAVDVAYGEPAWTHHQAAPVSTGILATAGGIVFAGDVEPSLKAFDAKTGELLWRGQLDDVPSSSLISYAVDGRQFVAVLVGISNLHVMALNRSWDELRAEHGFDDPPPKGGAGIWVFSL